MTARSLEKLNYTFSDKLMLMLACLLLLFIWGLTITRYNSLPDTIPIHYNASGEADGFGARRHLLTLPLIATVLFALLSILGRYLFKLKYPAHITYEQALKQYTLAGRLFRYMNCVIQLLFSGIVFQTIQHAAGHSSGLGVWFMPLSLALIFIPLLYFIIKSLQI